MEGGSIRVKAEEVPLGQCKLSETFPIYAYLLLLQLRGMASTSAEAKK
jgi:hypothetical protein